MAKQNIPVLSVCMIVKNEAHQLAEALENFRPFADETVVVDTGSTDASPEIARRCDARVFDFPWRDDFAAARNHSLAQASGRYVLWMDADDRVEPHMAERLNELKGVFDGRNAFYFILQDMNANGPSCSFYQLRCAPRLDQVRFHGRIHERLSIEGLAPLTTDIVIQHHGYINREIHQTKVKRNLALLEKELESGTDDAYLHYYLSLTYEGLGRLEEAVQHMRRALTHIEVKVRRSQTPVEKQLNVRALMEIHFHMARLFIDLHQKDTALRHITLVRSLGGDDARSQFRLGLIYQQLDRPRDALRCFQRAIVSPKVMDIFPSPPLPSLDRLHIHIAFSRLRLREHAAALESIKTAHALGLDPVEGWELLGFLALKVEEWSIARLAYESGLAAGELSDSGYYFLGMLQRRTGLSRKALECFRRAVEINPNHENARSALVEIRAEFGGDDLVDVEQEANRVRSAPAGELRRETAPFNAKDPPDLCPTSSDPMRFLERGERPSFVPAVHWLQTER